MFGFLKPSKFLSESLGELVYSRGLWRGKMDIEGRSVPLAIAGDRYQPDESAIAEATEVPVRLLDWRETIEQSLYAHYLPYADTGHPGLPPLPIWSPRDAWANALLESASVTPMDGVQTIELVFATGWDEEHLLGARFQAGKFIELCGSTIPS